MHAVRLLFTALLASALPVGHSVQGRALAPVVLGSAPPAHRLLVVGFIHGTEPAGLPIVRALQEAGAPAGAEIVLLPALNPDGCAAGTRVNAHGVDLNRNFPSNWAAIGSPGSLQYSGPRAGSEAETRYFMQLVRALQPAVTVVFHQHQDVVRAWGQSRATARRFSQLLGGVLPYRAWRWPYGTAANWQNHAFPGTASFVVELPAGAVPTRLLPRYVQALRQLAVGGYVR
jgi:protein MpaA